MKGGKRGSKKVRELRGEKEKELRRKSEIRKKVRVKSKRGGRRIRVISKRG